MINITATDISFGILTGLVIVQTILSIMKDHVINEQKNIIEQDTAELAKADNKYDALFIENKRLQTENDMLRNIVIAFYRAW